MSGHRHERGTSRIRSAVAALCTILMIASMAGPALADSAYQSQLPAENATSHPAFDALFLRPLGFVALAGGVALFVPAALLTMMTRPQEIDVPLGWLVIAPARYVWVDPLGKH